MTNKPKRITEPATDPAAEPQNPIEAAVQDLIVALGYVQEDIAGVDIRSGGQVRIYTTDNTARGAKIAALKRWPRDPDGRVLKP